MTVWWLSHIMYCSLSLSLAWHNKKLTVGFQEVWFTEWWSSLRGLPLCHFSNSLVPGHSSSSSKLSQSWDRTFNNFLCDVWCFWHVLVLSLKKCRVCSQKQLDGSLFHTLIVYDKLKWSMHLNLMLNIAPNIHSRLMMCSCFIWCYPAAVGTGKSFS